ncbi:hypothetical protein PG997_014569 [Apiospora hydei]|uniref:Uncharacterized protein n=1 Tax=Apiospora hydei TaxID=1337664 RepID=A0ABR1UUA1_9PEZI
MQYPEGSYSPNVASEDIYSKLCEFEHVAKRQFDAVTRMGKSPGGSNDEREGDTQQTLCYRRYQSTASACNLGPDGPVNT